MNRTLRAVARCLVACIFLLCGGYAPISAAQTTPEVARGLQWLQAQVNASGDLADADRSLASPVQARAETVLTLRQHGAVPVALFERVVMDQEANTEYLARQVMVRTAAGRDISDQINQLLARQNDDGGFGGAMGYESNPLDTALALAALQKAPSTIDAVARASTYLVAVQASDGALSLSNSEASAYVTALASSALQKSAGSTQNQTAVSRANAWLLSLQKADGSWGSVPETSLVWIALIGTTSDSALHTIVSNAIVSKQAADGSWDGDPYVTALALRALSVRPQPASPNGAVIGQVLDAVTGLPLTGANMIVAQVPGASTSSDAAGKFALAAIAPGSYNFSISAAGYGTMNGKLSVQSGMTTTIGVVALAPLANSGTVQGTVRDSANKLPLVGVLIKVSGASNGSITSQTDGSYRLSGLAPGLIQLSVSKPGYASVNAEGNIVAGAVLAFNPNLTASTSTASLSGRVVDGATRLPLGGVAVSTTTPSVTAVTSADGRFTLGTVTGGNVQLALRLAGYAGKTVAFLIEPGVNTDLQTIAMDKTATPSTKATVQGLVRASADGQPLANVTVLLNGSSNMTTSTATDGSFQFAGVAPGALTLSVSKTGYVTAGGTGTAVAGQSLVFNARLDLSTVPGIAGQVVDSVTASPLPGAKVTLDINSLATRMTVTADASGRFLFAGVAGGNHNLTLEAAAYTTRTVPVVSGDYSLTDLHAIKLASSSKPVALSGKVTDLKTGLGIGRAAIAVLGSARSAITDAAGNYRIEDLAQGPATIRYSAVGYNSDTVIVDLSPYGEVPQDRALSAAQGSSLALALGTDRAHYAAYTPVAITATVNNSGVETGSGTLSVTILDQHGSFLDSFMATHLGSDGGKQNVFRFVPGTSRIDLSWHTMAFPPGAYSVIARIHQAVDASSAGAVELAQSQAVFTLDPTAAIASVRLTPSPAFTNLGATEQLGYRVDVVNRSNVAVSSRLGYQLRTPAMALADSGTLAIDLLPAESSKSFAVTGPAYTFLASGSYSMALEVTDGAVPETIAGGQVEVAPGTRIELQQTVLPARVVPDGDKRIHIDIRLQGIEQK